MESKITRLLREKDPQAGMLASPVPQYWDRDTQAPREVEGYGGAPGAVLFDENGQPIGTVGNPLHIRAYDTDQLLGQLKAALEALRDKDFATQATLTQVRDALTALSGIVGTAAGQADIRQAINDLESRAATEATLWQLKAVLDTISAKVATETTLASLATALATMSAAVAKEATLTTIKTLFESGDAKVQLKGSSITEAQAVPVRKKNAVATQVGTNVNVAAGALVTIHDSTDAARDEIAVYARVNASHAWALYVLFLGGDGSYIRHQNTAPPQLSDSGTSDRLFIQRSKVHAVRVHIRIQNNDSVSHTYNVWKYEWYL